MEPGHLDGKLALVTGSSRNLGAAIAQELATRGATVVVTYNRSRDAATELVRRLQEMTGRQHHAYRADLSSSSETRTLCSSVLAEVGVVDILVNNAGPFAMAPYVELAEEDWDTVWDTNVKSIYVCTQVLAPHMRQKGWGRIINISAGSAYTRNHSIYSLAKQAVVILTEQLALELGPEITVNAVAPGQIAESADDIAEFDPSFVERAVAHTPTGRLVTRPEVASLVADLCAPGYDMVTGATIPVDGGWRISRF